MIKHIWGWFENHNGQLAVVSGNDDTEVSNEIIKQIKDKGRIVGEFISKHIYFEMLIDNFEDVLKAISDFERAEQNFKFEQEFIPYSSNVNRLFINALGSIYTYLNHYEHCLSSSESSSDIERLTSKYFDERPLYRFLYKLRNFVVHINMPITDLSFSIEKPQKEFYLVKSYLLEKFNWGDKVTNDLKLQEDKISVKAVINDAINMFLEFHLELMGVQIKEVLEIQQYYDSIGRIQDTYIRYPVVLNVDENDTNSVSIEDLFTDNVFLIERAMKTIGIDAHTGKAVTK